MFGRRRGFGFAAGLIVLVVWVFAGVLGNGFVTYDDKIYLTGNPWVKAGLTPRGILWAFTTVRGSNWHPLTWLSHMLDVQLFGMNAAAHHLVGLAIHAANAVLIFALLANFSGSPWSCALVAALFATHPLHVESVAWAAERKDLLSTFGALLAVSAYLASIRRRGNIRRSITVPLLFACALLAKPMPVTLPFLLLLLDWWPLGRWSPTPGAPSSALQPLARILPPARLWAEKLPLFALATVSSTLTLYAQSRGQAIISFETLPFASRIVRVPEAYFRYLVSTVWPRGLAVFHPWEHASADVVRPIAAFAGLLAVTAFTAATARRRPWIAVGWLWYLGTLVPVIGLVQVGGHAIADRYTYFSLTGIFIVVVWSMASLTREKPGLAIPFVVTSGFIVLAFALAARTQVAVWRSEETLMRRAVDAVLEKWMALNNLGLALAEARRLDEAEASFRRSLAINPRQPAIIGNLGRIAEMRGDRTGAVEAYQRAIAMDPRCVEAHNNLGALLAEQGKIGPAREHFEIAARVAPDDAVALVNLGRALLLEGRKSEALGYLRRVLREDPFNDEARRLLGTYERNEYQNSH